MEKKVYLKDVGEVVLRRSERARRISIRITPAGKVTVTVPFLTGWNKAAFSGTEEGVGEKDAHTPGETPACSTGISSGRKHPDTQFPARSSPCRR
jgi:hypothetical protein